MAENFNLIFGSNAPDSTTWSDADYQTGWATVGSTPPTAEQFDFLQNRADLKAKELKDTIDPLVQKATEEGRQPSTAYALGDTATADGIPTAWFLECTTAGVTDSGTITVPSPLSEGGVITDGTVVWTVRKTNSISNTLNMGVFNKKETFTSSGSFTAPVTGTYRITLQGGGGGGGSAGNVYTRVSDVGTGFSNGVGGGGGGGLQFYVKLTAGTLYNFVIGAGGTGGTGQETTASTYAGQEGTTGGTTSITIDNVLYEATGGSSALVYSSTGYASPGVGKIDNVQQPASSGQCGPGGQATPTYVTKPKNVGGAGKFGGEGGYGGNFWYDEAGTYHFATGGAGTDGFISFEYCDL